jgi:hypothetical protein
LRKEKEQDTNRAEHLLITLRFAELGAELQPQASVSLQGEKQNRKAGKCSPTKRHRVKDHYPNLEKKEYHHPSMTRDPIDQLLAIRAFVSSDKENPTYAELSDTIRSRISGLFQVARRTVTASGLDIAAILRAVVNFQRIAGLSQPTIKIDEPVESPAAQVIRETNELIAQRCATILQEIRDKYPQVVTDALAPKKQEFVSDDSEADPESKQRSA